MRAGDRQLLFSHLSSLSGLSGIVGKVLAMAKFKVLAVSESRLGRGMHPQVLEALRRGLSDDFSLVMLWWYWGPDGRLS